MNPAAALAGYDLSSDERSALTDSEKLADVFKNGIISELPSITIKICETHDWVNRTPTRKKSLGRDTCVENEVEAIRRASTAEERTTAVVRLMELIG